MSISQGQRPVREYASQFETLLGRLDSYDEVMLLNQFVWGLQPKLARSVSLHYPKSICSARVYSTDVYQTIFRTRTLAHNSETPPPQRKVYNLRSRQKQGARFTRVHIYNQM